tara:strand:- start:698 stop:1222 length:525 start_codon:yes stop_codon:yes gene_type:complete
MGSVSPDDGAFGEFDANPGVNSDADNVLAIMEMNREAERADAERDRKLDIKGIAAPEEDDDLLDFSNPTRDGAAPLESNFFDDFDFDEALAKASGLGGKGSGPQSLGSGGGLRTSFGERNTRGSGFGKIMGDSPYQAPSYYSPQGSVIYQGMTRELIKGLLSNSIRKPILRSLV